MRIPINDLAAIGVVKDVEDYLLPPNAWTDVRNVRLHDGRVERALGAKVVLNPPSVAPYWLLHCYDSAKVSHWLYAGLGRVYDFSAGTHTEITKLATTYGATADGLWNGGVLGNLPVINNGVDKPQVWNPIAAGTKLVDLPNWPATHTAKIIRPFKNFLFALDITEGATRFIHRVRVSHPADPGTVPSSWDDTLATKDVYVQDLSDTAAGGLLDCLPLRDANILYKESSTWGMQYIGGRFKWRLYPIFESIGALSDHCMVAFGEDKAMKHFVMTGEDLIIHNGQQATSVINKKLQKWIRSNISSTKFGRSFCALNTEENECWFCFPLEGSDFCNLAIVYNWVDGSITFQDIDQASFIASGQIPLETADTWDADTGFWDTDTTVWDQLAHQPFIDRMLQAKPSTTKLLHLNTTNQFSDVNYTAYIERTGFDLAGIDRYGKLIHDRDSYKLINGVWIQASGAPFTVQLGSQLEAGGSITWSEGKVFTPGVDKKADIGVNAKLFGVRFTSTANAQWRIQSYEPDVEVLGTF